MPRQTVLTGVRPTGPLHLGHYAGALENWVRLQEAYECFFLIADYQVSDYAGDIARVRESVREVALDWLAVGDGRGYSWAKRFIAYRTVQGAITIGDLVMYYQPFSERRISSERC